MGIIFSSGTFNRRTELIFIQDLFTSLALRPLSPLINFFGHSLDPFGHGTSKIVQFIGILLQIVQMIVRRVPLMKFTVMTRYILTTITLDQFPLSLDAPNVLKGVIGIAQGHVVG